MQKVRDLVPAVVTLTLFLMLVVAIASTYFGHSSSPYNGCIGENGRAVPCDVLEAVR
jgi:hypothetical protein